MTLAPNPLLGSWRLVRWEIAYSDGRPSTLPFGRGAVGLICYTADGHMSASIARAVRQRPNAWPRSTASFNTPAPTSCAVAPSCPPACKWCTMW